ncbi:MAG: hypothetical protein ACPGN3_01965 [Opitutales bacterium]
MNIAHNTSSVYIVASSYEGTLLGVSYEGDVLWENKLSGFMNRDVWAADITGDGVDEILAANADGALYCLSGEGEVLWEFRPHEVPMNAVAVVEHDGHPVVVCGGYDNNIYYLDATGRLIKTVASSVYSTLTTWGGGKKRMPPSPAHIANFIRPVRMGERQAIAVHGVNFSNKSSGPVFLFDPLEETPFYTSKRMPYSAGDLRITDLDGDGFDEIIGGSSGMIHDAGVSILSLSDFTLTNAAIHDLRNRVAGFGYRVAQSIPVKDGTDATVKLLTAYGSDFILSDMSLQFDQAEILKTPMSFNDLWQDEQSGKVIFASAQSGGSCIHILNTEKNGWKEALQNIGPQGKLAEILENTEKVHALAKAYKKPKTAPKSRTVYMLTESLGNGLKETALNLQETYGSPVFLDTFYSRNVEDWDRSSLDNAKYRERRDARRDYRLSQGEAESLILSHYDTDLAGLAYWGGHGNDPYMFQTQTLKNVAKRGADLGKKTVFIFPELEQWDDNFAFVLDNHIYPLAEVAQEQGAKVYVRTKHTFWQSINYMPLWSRLMSGEFADTFVPSMEETTDKSMELSVAARLGVWASGAVDDWGSRAARDNPSFDRLREFSHQKTPSHFLRAQVYNIALGATYQNNFPTNQRFFSVIYDLIAKGILYVPERDQIVSFNPVHLSMVEPDPLYVDQGNNVKWLTMYDASFEAENPMVFGRLDGSWPGSPVNEWDFSRYAADAHERRLNFLPKYPNGVVMITPPQRGKHRDTEAIRGNLKDNLHPLYRNILREYFTDGRDYISADGNHRIAAPKYAETIEQDIKNSAKFLPLTVEGEVAWVTAEPAPGTLRLTLVENGYLNPNAQTAKIRFNTIRPKSIRDVLTGESIPFERDGTASVEVPLGLFKFLEIEYSGSLVEAAAAYSYHQRN